MVARTCRAISWRHATGATGSGMPIALVGRRLRRSTRSRCSDGWQGSCGTRLPAGCARKLRGARGQIPRCGDWGRAAPGYPCKVSIHASMRRHTHWPHAPGHASLHERGGCPPNRGAVQMVEMSREMATYLFHNPYSHLFMGTLMALTAEAEDGGQPASGPGSVW